MGFLGGFFGFLGFLVGGMGWDLFFGVFVDCFDFLQNSRKDGNVVNPQCVGIRGLLRLFAKVSQ